MTPMNSVQIPPQIPTFSKIQITIFALVLLSSSCSGFVRNTGMLKLCPPGGEAFATAWQLTCGMRKKRSIEDAESDVIKELQKQLNQGSSSPEGLAVDEEPMKKRDSSFSKKEYRPLSMTEMMHFCCRYGCTFRDLLPYCDPFGQWDS